jgi:hypothetical protein
MRILARRFARFGHSSFRDESGGAGRRAALSRRISR